MVAVITNIDREHLDHFGSEQALTEAFLDFADRVPFYGLVVLGGDSPRAMELAPRLVRRHVTYGLRSGDYRGEILDARPDGTRFRITVSGKARGEAHVRMPGVHYAENALGALCVADYLGVSFQDYCAALESFQGVDRRFSVRGESGGVLVVDDYGHHPTELAATVAAARLYQRRLIVAFQPHRYTRTRDLLPFFAPTLSGADVVLLTDIYAAGEPPIEGISTEKLMTTFPRGKEVRHVRRADLAGELHALARSGDLVLVLGAGDITHVAGELLALLEARGTAA
jgi:UDP-N-acetylmuramate--alanine ligase